MSDSRGENDPRWYVGMVLAILATLILVLVAVRSAPEPEFWTGREAYRRLVAARWAVPGVRATLSAGAVVVERRLPALHFRLERGETLDPSLPAGPFRGVFEVTFDPGAVRTAFIGAELQGGSIIARRGAEVILADATGDEPRRAMSTLALGVGPGRETVSFEFASAAGAGSVALRALWQPMGAAAPSPLPGDAEAASGATAEGDDGMLPGAADPR